MRRAGIENESQEGISMKKAVKDVASEVAEKISADVKDAPKTAKKAASKAAKAAKTVSKTAKDTAELAGAKTREVTTGARKVMEKKTAARKSPKEVVYLQYAGKELDTAELIQRVKQVWTKEMKKKASEFKNVKLYVKPEENKAYYVINDEVTGCIEL